MSWKATGKVWDLDLPHSKMLVLLAMADHANHEGGDIKPSIGTIAWKVGYSERQVRRVVRDLEQLGILKPEGSSEFGTMTYTINFEAAPKKAPVDKKPNGRPAQNPRTKCPPVSDKTPGHFDRNPRTFETKPPDILTETPGHSYVRQTVEEQKVNGTRTDTEASPPSPCAKKKDNPLSIPIPEEIRSPELQEAWSAYVVYRRKIDNPLTEYAAKLIFSKLITLTAGLVDRSSEAVLIVNQSIERGWVGVFPLKNDRRNFATQKSLPDYSKGF